MKRSIYYFISLMASLMLWSCSDDVLYDKGDGFEGDCTLSASLTYKTEEADLGSRSAGDLIQNITTLHVLVYDTQGNLIRCYRDGELSDYVNIKDQDNRDDATLGDDKTGRATFSLTIPRGRYYIYAVANVPDLHTRTSDIATRDGLKAISFDWDDQTIANNSQMFGIFSIGGDPNATDSNPVVLNKANIAVKSWLKRLASKVTVAFDGSDLYDNIEIYIKDIRIKDIPKRCSLGLDNTPGDASDANGLKRYEVANGVIADGEVMTVNNNLPEDPNNLYPTVYYHVCNDQHRYGGVGTDGKDPSILDETHAHKAESLYFFENIQHEGKEKSQSINNTTIWYPNPEEGNLNSGWKDHKPYGTYVEVSAIYRNRNTTSVGNIIYRFMLGQDIHKDYNAKRNTHYKLTLEFHGNGNEADWHIEYDEDPGIYVVSPQYISYLYNKEMQMDVKVVGDIDPDYGLKANVLWKDDNGEIATSWRPWGDPENQKDFPMPTDNFYYTGDVFNDGPWNTFLSLREAKDAKIVVPGDEDKASWQTAHDTKYNQEYWNAYKRGERTYYLDERDDEYGPDPTADYKYKVIRGTENNIFKIHLFTRAKELIAKTGFSGNNPYYTYPRHGKIRFTARLKDGTPIQKDVDVIQVRRIVNPKGVWRSHNRSEDFHVTLMRLPQEDATDFVSFSSVGPWYAEVVKGEGFISLESTPVGRVEDKQTGKRIEGDSEHLIDLKIKFNGTCGENQSRCGLVKIRYHNYTCEHVIMVRQGFAPLTMNGQAASETNPAWSSFNVYSLTSTDTKYGYQPGNYTANMAASPLDEGSYFRWNNVNAILSSNNDKYGFEEDGTNAVFDVIPWRSTNAKTMKWSEMVGGNANWKIKNSNARVARYEDFEQLESTPGSGIEKAYGVLYGDGATETATSVADAFGYDSNEDPTDSPKGMRGCFVYNSETGNNIFFPIGKSGYGRRKDGRNAANTHKGEGSGETGKTGVLRYAQRQKPYQVLSYYGSDYTGGVEYQPLFFDLYKRYGAVYWLEQPGGTKKADGTRNTNHTAWDINYFTMGFEGFETGAQGKLNGNKVFDQSDACLMRVVYTK